MRYYLFAVALLFASCKKDETHLTGSETTAVSIGHDTTLRQPSTTTADTSRSATAPDTSSSADRVETGQRLLPVDEANMDDSFFAFRQQLIRAVGSKNASELIPVLDSNIRLSFGGAGGIADFRKMWKPQDKNSPLWTKLDWVLKHGGSFRGEGNNRMFWAPYVYSQWPENGPEPFEYGAIVGKRIPVFAKADSTSLVLSSLDHHFVKVLDKGHLREKSPAFVRIQTPSGKTGFVRSTEIRSQLDYRAGFDKRSGKWKMAIFIAGD